MRGVEPWQDYGIESVKNKERYCLTFAPPRRSSQVMKVAAAIRDKLTAAFAPVALDVTDESARHAGHAGATRDDGSQGETHFHVRIVSAAFAGVSRVQRQRLVYDALKDEL